MRRIRFRRPSPAMAVAMVALFVALGGTGYAALKLPPQSVGKKELKRNAVTTTKIDNGTIRLKDIYRRDLRRLRRAAAGGGDADDFEDFEDFDDFEEPDEPDQPSDDGGSDSVNGAAVLTGAAGGLPDSGDPVERAPLTGLGTADDSATVVATLSPIRDLTLSDLSVALDNDVPAGASVAVQIVARALADPAETLVLGCTVTGTAGTADRTCTAAGRGTLPPNQLFYVRITVSGGGVSLNRGYWGVSVEP